MSSSIHKSELLPSINFQTVTPLFFIGLLIWAANIAYLYQPSIAFCFIILLVFQKRWQINHLSLKIAMLLTLIPLLVNLSTLAFKKILILLLVGFSSLSSDIYIKLSGNDIFYIVNNIIFTLILFSIAILSTALFFLNIFFPICNKIIRAINIPLFLIPMLACFFLGLLGVLIDDADTVEYLTDKFKNSAELIIDKKIDDYHIRAYRTNYEGALGSYGVEVKQEKHLPFHLKLVRNVSQYYDCDNVQLDVLNNYTIRIKPNIYHRTANTDLSLPKTFNIKPFHTTEFLKFLS